MSALGTSRLFAMLVCCAGVAACCPTLWLGVTKGDPVPRPGVTPPAEGGDAIVMPPVKPNRFDVLRDGARREDVPQYSDYFDPGSDVVSQRARAIQGLRVLEQIPGAHGTMIDPLDAQLFCSSAKLQCEEKGKRCMGLYVAATPLDAPVAASVLVNGQRRYQVIDRCNVEIPDYLKWLTWWLPDRFWQDPPFDRNRPCQISPWGHVLPMTFVKFATQVDIADGETLDESQPVEVCLSENLNTSRTLLSFIHLSDIQLRDGSVRLENENLSHRLDWLIQSFEYDPDLQNLNPYMVWAVFGTINSEVARYSKADRDRPAFIVHTGDIIDAGTVSELRLVHGLVDQLSIPFFDALGNHDVLTFGNLIPTDNRESDRTCATVESISGPVWWFWGLFIPNNICVDRKVTCLNDRCVEGEAQLVAGTKQATTRNTFITGLGHDNFDAVNQLSIDTFSRNHGFDLNRNLGYYSFAQNLPLQTDAEHRSRAVFVVLNSEDLPDNQGGTAGHIGAQQLCWLKNILKNAKEHDMIFVFAHQPLSKISIEGERGETLASVLHNPHVVAYLYGHDHQHSLCGDSRPDVCSNFWEIETASLIEIPQEGRLVRIKQATSSLAFLDVTSFSAHLDSRDVEFSSLVQRARLGAERDHCLTHRGPCNRLTPIRTDGRDTSARLFFRIP